MKKYAVIKKLNGSVIIESLKKHGFCVTRARHVAGDGIVSVNSFEHKVCDHGGSDRDAMVYYLKKGAQILLEDDFLAMLAAGEIDGQKKPWEVAPEGYRLVTDEEREKHIKPRHYKYILNNRPDKWDSGSSGGGWGDQDCVYAVPLDFTFDTDMDRKKRELKAQVEVLLKQIDEIG